MNPTKYRKKPVVIEAVQWVEPEQANDITKWADSTRDDGWGPIYYDGSVSGPSDPVTGEDWGDLTIETREGRMSVTPRDWIIRGVAGEFYACKPDIFEQTYEPAEKRVWVR